MVSKDTSDLSNLRNHIDTESLIKISDKYCLTIKEAAKYFGIGEKKLRQLATENMDCGVAIQNVVKVLIKRERMEQFLNNTSSI